MASNTVFLITGANRGIGFGLTALLLLRPNTTVIATVRSPSTSIPELEALTIAEHNRLIIVTLSSTSDVDAAAMISGLSKDGIAHIDSIIANAGAAETFESTISTLMSELRQSFEINTLGPIKLFKAAYPLLKKSTNPKFIFISSSLGSIGAMEGNVPSLAYGVSKAAANYFVRKVHFEHENVTAVAVHPGWVKTANGQAFADAIGAGLSPPMSTEGSVKAILEQVDKASRSTTSGSFVSYDGTVIPW